MLLPVGRDEERVFLVFQSEFHPEHLIICGWEIVCFLCFVLLVFNEK